jgi:hypothetical protein
MEVLHAEVERPDSARTPGGHEAPAFAFLPEHRAVSFYAENLTVRLVDHTGARTEVGFGRLALRNELDCPYMYDWAGLFLLEAGTPYTWEFPAGVAVGGLVALVPAPSIVAAKPAVARIFAGDGSPRRPLPAGVAPRVRQAGALGPPPPPLPGGCAPSAFPAMNRSHMGRFCVRGRTGRSAAQNGGFPARADAAGDAGRSHTLTVPATGSYCVAFSAHMPCQHTGDHSHGR